MKGETGEEGIYGDSVLSTQFVTLKLLKSNLLITKEKLNYLYEAGAFLIL